jgi:hypothetical protein
MLFTATIARTALRAWRLWRWRRAQEPLLPDLADPDLVRAMYLRPGLAVRNPLGHEPWVLDLVAVSRPDVELMVTLTGLQDTVRVSLDWPVEIYTAAAADLEAVLLLDEHQRLVDLDRRRNP